MSQDGTVSEPLAYVPAPGGRQRATWDIVLSIVFLVGAGVAWVGGGFVALFFMAFTDYCPPGCDIDAGVNAVYTVGLVTALIGVAALVGTVVLLVTRRRGWWVALAGGILIAVGWVIALALYGDAVSAA